MPAGGLGLIPFGLPWWRVGRGTHGPADCFFLGAVGPSQQVEGAGPRLEVPTTCWARA